MCAQLCTNGSLLQDQKGSGPRGLHYAPSPSLLDICRSEIEQYMRPLSTFIQIQSLRNVLYLDRPYPQDAPIELQVYQGVIGNVLYACLTGDLAEVREHDQTVAWKFSWTSLVQIPKLSWMPEIKKSGADVLKQINLQSRLWQVKNKIKWSILLTVP